jgi:excisionase family DNA binding protein
VTIDPQRHAVDGLASIKEACAFLSIGKSSLYQQMARGAIPFVYLGSRRLIPRAALVEWTENVLDKGRYELSG